MALQQQARPHGLGFDRIRLLRAHEYVAEQIRRHIALRLVAPGEALPSERELAATFGVGRATIQRALRILEADHLVETRRGRNGGSFPVQPGEDSLVLEGVVARIVAQRHELEEVLVFRRTLEPRIARVAAEARSEEDIAAMRGQIKAMAQAGSEPEYMRHDTEFHLAVAMAARNRYFVRAVEEIRMKLNDVMSLLPESETWHRRISTEHDVIVDAIAFGDAEAAEAAAELHIARSDQSIRAVLTLMARDRPARGSRARAAV